MPDPIPPVIPTADYFRYTLQQLKVLAKSDVEIPAIIDTATFRRLSLLYTGLIQTSGGGGASGPIIASALTMAANRLLGRTTAGSGSIEEIAIGNGLSFAAGLLSTALATTATQGAVPALGANFATLRNIDGLLQSRLEDEIPLNVNYNSTNGTGANAGGVGSVVASGSPQPAPAGQVSTGSTSTGSSLYGYGGTTTTSGGIIPSRSSLIIGSATISVVAVSTVSETFLAYAGLLGAHGAANTAITNMVGFRVEDTALKAVCMNGGSETTLTWGTAFSTTLVRVQFIWDVTGGSVKFFVNGTSIGSITTNIPSTSQTQKLEFAIYKTVGAANSYFQFSNVKFIPYP